MKLSTCLILTFLLSFNAFAEIHKWIDSQGNIHYSDKKPENTKTTPIEIKPHPVAKSLLLTSTAAVPAKIAVDTNPYKKKKKVVMYAASWCGYCKKARTFFRKNKIRYTEYDIEKNVQAKSRYVKLGGTGIPLIVSGKKKMQGFSENKFERFYLGL